MYSFDFVKATTIADAAKALSHEDGQALGGGQTLIPTLKSRLAQPAVLVSLNGIPVATVGLKNPLTGHRFEDARRQYKQDRDPREPIF